MQCNTANCTSRWGFSLSFTDFLFSRCVSFSLFLLMEHDVCALLWCAVCSVQCAFQCSFLCVCAMDVWLLKPLTRGPRNWNTSTMMGKSLQQNYFNERKKQSGWFWHDRWHAARASLFGGIISCCCIKNCKSKSGWPKARIGSHQKIQITRSVCVAWFYWDHRCRNTIIWVSNWKIGCGNQFTENCLSFGPNYNSWYDIVPFIALTVFIIATMGPYYLARMLRLPNYPFAWLPFPIAYNCHKMIINGSAECPFK